MDYVDWDSDEHWDVKEIHRCDLLLVLITIKRILCKHFCSMVPIINNQLGVGMEIESLEAFWDLERDLSSPPPQSVSPEACNVTQDEEIDVGEELTVQTTIVTPEGSRFSVLEAPPPLVKKVKKTQKKRLKRHKKGSKKPNCSSPNYSKAFTNKSLNNFYMNSRPTRRPGCYHKAVLIFGFAEIPRNFFTGVNLKSRVLYQKTDNF